MSVISSDVGWQKYIWDVCTDFSQEDLIENDDEIGDQLFAQYFGLDK